MKSIINSLQYEYKINGSKFISVGYYIEDEQQVKQIVNDIKNNNRHAAHVCYAYKIDNIYHFDDDGEPINSAGKKILDVINIQKFNRTLIVVIRYMNKTKLGIGLLSRSYYNSAFLVANDLDNICQIKEIDIYEIKCSSAIFNKVINLLKNNQEKIVDQSSNDIHCLIKSTINKKFNLLNECEINFVYKTFSKEKL